MRVLRELTPSPRSTAVALGFFDGVHRGHRAVLSAAVSCRREGLTPAAFFFTSSPKKDSAKQQLSSNADKIRMFEEIGIERLYIIDFERLKNKTPYAFVKDVLRDVFNAKKVFCGFNYRFGRAGSGDTELLRELCSGQGIDAFVCDTVVEDGVVVSSSEIRRLLRAGEIKRANRLLGYDFGVRSASVEGNHIGTLMHTPTVNLRFPENTVLPRFGVYASIVTIDGERYIGVTNVGVKPTITDAGIPNCETWMPEYRGGELYGKTVDVRLRDFIRPERKFSGLQELEEAIKRDGNTALSILK